MRKASAIITVALAILTTGCVLSGKNAKPVAQTPPPPKPVAQIPPPPPQPLSIPQTQVELPRPQPLDPAAFATEPPPPAEAPPETSSPRPQNAGTRRPGAGTGSQPARGEGSSATPPATSGTPTPALPPAATPEPAGPTIQEIISPQEVKRLQEQANGRRREASQIVEQLAKRNLTLAQRNVIATINSFIASSLEADKKGDVKVADALAERAQILAKDLLNGK
jgi:hypothetical protein